MKRILIQMAIAFLCLPSTSIAQVSSEIAKSYPAVMVFQLDELNSKLKLSEDKQLQIIRKLYTADSLASLSLIKNGSSSQLKAYYSIDNNFLKPILSSEELDRYGYLTDRNNRFSTALFFSSHLKLESGQIKEIRRLNDSLLGVPKLSEKETIRIYNKKLQGILSQQQYVSVLKTIYHEQSEEEADRDWTKIIKLKLADDKSDRKEYVKILNYHIGKNAFLDKKAERYGKTKRDFLAKKMALGEPPILVHANILSEDGYINNKYSSIIKCEKELELSQSQIDTLLVKYSQLERAKLENKENESNDEALKAVPSEYENIARILAPEQVKKWLIQKNKQAAKKEARKNWEELEAEGLTKDLDKDKALTEFAVYQLQFLVIKDRALVYHTQENIFAKRDIEKKKPDLLKQLDAINLKKSKNAKTKQALAW